MYVAISYPNIRFILETYTYLIHTFYLKSITSHYFRGEKLYTILHVHAGILISHTRMGFSALPSCDSNYSCNK